MTDEDRLLAIQELKCRMAWQRIQQGAGCGSGRKCAIVYGAWPHRDGCILMVAGSGNKRYAYGQEHLQCQECAAREKNERKICELRRELGFSV